MPYVCDVCGLCCNRLIIEIEHVDVLREPKLQAATQLVQRDYATEWDKRYLLACGEFRPCPMLGSDNLCAIYPTRPSCCIKFTPGSPKCQELRRDNGLEPLVDQP